MIEYPDKPRAMCSETSVVTKEGRGPPSTPVVQEGFPEEVTLDSISKDRYQAARIKTQPFNFLVPQ